MEGNAVSGYRNKSTLNVRSGAGRGLRACAHRRNAPFSCVEEEDLVLRSAIPCCIFGPAKPSNVQVNNASVQRITGYAARVVMDRVVVRKGK